MRDILMRAGPHCGQLQHSHTGYIQFLPQPITTPVLQLLKSEPPRCFHSLIKRTFYTTVKEMKPEYLPTVGRGVQRDLCKLLLNSLK